MQIASLEVAITANTAGAERGFAQTNALLNQLVANSGAANMSVTRMAGGIALGTVAAHAFMGALSAVAGGLAGMGKGAIDLASRLEQAKIGFTTMLGGAQQADAFIRKLQAFAESTAFSFPGIQQVAQSFMAMGIEAKNVIPIVTDISNALAAAGRGGDTEALQRVGMSLSEIAAQGKVTAEQLRELSRNGIAVMPMLADAMGKTTAEVRKLAEAGEISATQFFEAFHSQVAQRYGDIQAQQAKTWAVAITNVQDILGRLTTETLSEFFGALTQGALLIQDFLKSDRAAQWAADFKASIHEVMAALAPLGAALQAAMGVGGAPTGPQLASKPLGPSPAEVAKAMTVPPVAIQSAADYSAQIKAATADIHNTTAALTALTSQQDALKITIEDTQRVFELRLTGLKDQQEALNLTIEQTKAEYEAVLEPMNRMQAQLGRLAEDTKADFARILDPLKASLDSTNRQIDDTKAKFARLAEPLKMALDITNRRIDDAKTGYEAMTRPIQAQITAIDKANTALSKQRALETQIADLKLRQRILAAAGDPVQQGEIARRMKLNEFAQDDIGRQIELLELGNRKGNNDKKIERLQSEANGIKAEGVKLEQQGADLINRSATAQIEKDRIILDAAKEKRDLAQADADIKANAAKAPLEDQLARLEADFKRVLDPLEAQQRTLTRQIEDTARAETAALKPLIDAQALLTRQIEDTARAETAALAPIIAAQEQLARQIEDVNQAQKDALKPLEDQQKAIAAAITATEAEQRKVLEPLKEQQTALERQRDILEQHKRQVTDQIAAWKDQTAAIKEAATEAAKVAKPLDLSGGDTGAADTPVPALAGKSMIPAGLIDSVRELSANVATLNTNFGNLNATMNSAGVPLGNVAEAIGKFSIAFVATGWVLGLAAAIGTGALAATATQALWAAWGIFVVAQIDTVRKEWEATDWTKMGTDWNNWLGGMQKAFVDWKVDWDAGWVTIWADWDRDWAKIRNAPYEGWNAFIQWLGGAFNGWKTSWWDTAWSGVWADWDRDWGKLSAAPAAAWNAFVEMITPALAGAAALFDPVVKAIEAVGNAIRNLPDLPGWAMGRLGIGGGGGAGINLPSGNGGGNMDLTAGNPGQNMIGLSGQDAAAACGPYAALLFANTAGRFPTSEEAIQLARNVGWTPGEGMGGMPNFLKLMGELGQSGQIDYTPSVEEIRAAMKAGSPAAISTNKHYFAATGIDENDRLNVGGTGTVMGGSEWMTLAEIDALGGGIQGVITLSQQFGEAVDVASARARLGLSTIMAPIQAVGGGIEGYIRQAAALRGIDPNTAVRVAMSEGGVSNPTRQSDVVKNGRQEQSFGPFQLNIEGGIGSQAMTAGIDPRNPADWQKAIDFALNEAVKNGWGAFHGAAGAGIGNREGLEGSHTATIQANAALSASYQTQTRDLQFNAQWVKTMADQQTALAQTLTGQVDPALINTKTAMGNFGAVLGPIERQVAGGSISLDTLQFKLTDLARATGVATKPFDDFSAGMITQEEAMRRVINAAADVNPQFDALRQTVNSANPDMSQATLDFLQMALNLGKVAPATAAATTATTGLVTATGAANSAIDPVLLRDAAVASDELAEALAGSNRAFTNVQESAARASEIVKEFLGASQSLGDYLDGHTFNFKVNLPDLPDWAIPGSPTPFETGLRGIGGALEDLSRKSGPALRSLEMPSSAAAVRSVAERGGGGGSSRGGDTYNFSFPNYIGSRSELIEEVHTGLLQKKRANGRLGLGDSDGR